MTRTIATFLITVGCVEGFAFLPSKTRTSTQLEMGIFDGVKDAFSAPALERTSSLDGDRETPIDRWMGWSVTSENQDTQVAVPVDFVDAMDAANYVAVQLPKPMGIVFEENDEEYGGIFVESLKEGGVAAENGVLQIGDQLIAVGSEKVSGMNFDDALGKIIESEAETTKLLLFRGNAKQFYGPTGASQEWLNEFIEAGGVSA
mmetsp:Transcript_940/g.1714  ORF Transcript_940/g.1714 Transcript_940/m.1714 type:complete len:203 (-) Transcript_940:516-1124(-)|eukprot:CAMPEP_0116559554 /NCGR_PEP_ID=MMETSP0397-20121206/10464_1 /TAXON_ID=216820 /ORGANISM="Cyclophora tenuis, Strain ECT3854" /LENGTH=202 /DNA_ID=CAMNT_0004085343 /DNA_START=111 /DNA_END=719 /DNA_ORIENTATION=+